MRRYWTPCSAGGPRDPRRRPRAGRGGPRRQGGAVQLLVGQVMRRRRRRRRADRQRARPRRARRRAMDSPYLRLASVGRPWRSRRTPSHAGRSPASRPAITACRSKRSAARSRWSGGIILLIDDHVPLVDPGRLLSRPGDRRGRRRPLFLRHSRSLRACLAVEDGLSMFELAGNWRGLAGAPADRVRARGRPRRSGPRAGAAVPLAVAARGGRPVRAPPWTWSSAGARSAESRARPSSAIQRACRCRRRWARNCSVADQMERREAARRSTATRSGSSCRAGTG